MKKEKKLLLAFCTGMLMLCIASCGREDGENNVSGDAGSVTQEGTSEEESSGSPEEGAPGDGESVPEGNVPSQEESPVSTEEGQTSGWSEEMQGIRSAVVEALGEENYWPDMPMEADMVEMFYGITPDMYEDYMAESPMISSNVDSLVIILAKEDQADAVEAALNTYREANVNDTMQYPQNLEKIQASRVEKIGNYVIFVQLGGYAVDSEDRNEALEKCQEANKLALDAIRGIVE